MRERVDVGNHLDRLLEQDFDADEIVPAEQ
jgi:hypothetical protein